MNLRDNVQILVKGLERENPKLAKGLKKWNGFLCSAVEKISFITSMPQEDVLGEIFLGLVKVNTLCSKAVYRYEGGLYWAIKIDGCSILLETTEFNSRTHLKFWTDLKNAELVNKQLESMIYREIHHQYMDLIGAHFRGKRGFEKTPSGERLVKIKDGKNGVRFEKRPVFDVKQTAFFLNVDGSYDDVEDYGNFPTTAETLKYLTDFENPEQAFWASEVVCRLRDRVSDNALLVLGCLLNDVERIKDISQLIGMSPLKVKAAKFEIMKQYENLCDEPKTGNFPNCLKASGI